MLSLLPRPATRPVPVARLAPVETLCRDDVTDMWPGASVEVNGQQLFVRATPPLASDAPPALFVHGLGGSGTNWTDLAGLLRGHLDIEAVDLPGFGRSGPSPTNDYSLRAHARTVIAYIEQSGRGPVHLVANSMGGAVSIRVAARRPDLVRTLTLISPAVPDIRLRIHALRNDWRMALMVLPGIGDAAMRRIAATATPEQRVRATIALCFADKTRFDPRRLAEAVREAEARMANAWTNDAFLRSLRGLARSQLAQGKQGWADLTKIAAPTLVIWGDTDRLVAPDLAPYVAGAVADSRLLELERIGHTAMMEDPVTTARAVVALLEDASG
jgi:pimeloyl-ACP methyl ester carboxylesterase